MPPWTGSTSSSWRSASKRGGGDWPLWILLAVMGLLLAWAVVEYWADD